MTSIPAQSCAQAVEVTHLRKVYGETVAVDDVSLSVAEGEIFVILGPNGAGKTTTVECVIGLRMADAGSIRVMGADPSSDRIVFGELPNAQLHRAALGGLTRFDAEVPVLATLVIAALALVSLPGPLATYRQEGILRRLATTPLPRSWALAAPVMINLGLAIVGVAIIFVLGHVAFALALPRSPAALALTLLLCVAALFAIGLAIAAVVHVSGLQLVSAATFLPLVFFAGLWNHARRCRAPCARSATTRRSAPPSGRPRMRWQARFPPPGPCS